MMRKARLLGAVCACLFSIGPLAAHAAITFTYVLNTSDFTGGHSNLTDSDTLTISFLDGTDLNNISSSNIFSYSYDLAAGITGTNYYDGGWDGELGDIGSAFAWDGSILSLTFDTLGGDYITNTDNLGNPSQLLTGEAWHIHSYFNNNNNSFMYGFITNGTTLTLTAQVATVPVPAAVWLFGSGLLGLIGISRRKKAT